MKREAYVVRGICKPRKGTKKLATNLHESARIFFRQDKQDLQQIYFIAEGAEKAEFVFGLAGVLGKVLFSKQALSQNLAFVHKAVKTAFLSSQPISYVVSRPKAQGMLVEGGDRANPSTLRLGSTGSPQVAQCRLRSGQSSKLTD